MRPRLVERVCLPLAPTGCQPEEAQAEENNARRLRNARKPADLDTGLKVSGVAGAASHLPINRKAIQSPGPHAVCSVAAVVTIETERESLDACAGRRGCLKTHIKGVEWGINEINAYWATRSSVGKE